METALQQAGNARHLVYDQSCDEGKSLAEWWARIDPIFISVSREGFKNVEAVYPAEVTSDPSIGFQPNLRGAETGKGRSLIYKYLLDMAWSGLPYYTQQRHSITTIMAGGHPSSGHNIESLTGGSCWLYIKIKRLFTG